MEIKAIQWLLSLLIWLVSWRSRRKIHLVGKRRSIYMDILNMKEIGIHFVFMLYEIKEKFCFTGSQIPGRMVYYLLK